MIGTNGKVHECSGERLEEDMRLEEMGRQCYAVLEGRQL